MSPPLQGRLRPAFLTQERAFTYGLAITVVYLAILAWAFWQRLWFVDAAGRPLAVDFINFWSAGFLTSTHDAAGIYDGVLYHSIEVQALGHEFDGYFPWVYPPVLLLLAAPLSLLPYLFAWLLWSVAGAAFLIFALRRVVPDRLAVPVVLAAPASLWCAVVGQTGFLTAGVMACALATMERRPWVAGFCIGLLSGKPQFGLLFPLFLIVCGRWRVFAGAALSTLLLVCLSALVFGIDTWNAFAASLSSTTSIVLMGGGSAWFKLQSFYALFYRLTDDPDLALKCHFLFCGALLTVLIWLWTRPASTAIKSASLVAAAFLVTPYAYVYDAVLLTVGVAFLIRDGLERGFLPGDRALLALAWFTPALFGTLGSFTSPLSCLLILGTALRRSMTSEAPISSHATPAGK